MLSNRWIRLSDMKIGRKPKKEVYEFIEFNNYGDDYIASNDKIIIANHKDSDGEWDADAISDIKSIYGSLEELRRQFPNKSDEEEAVAESIFVCRSKYADYIDVMSEEEAEQYLDDVVAGNLQY